MLRFFGGLAAALALFCAASPSYADNYVAKDGNGSTLSFAAKLFGGLLHPLHLFEGLANGTGNPTPLCVDDGTHGAPIGAVCQVQPDIRATGTINSATSNAAYAVAVNNGQGVVGFTVSGLTAAAATLTIEGSNDSGTTWSTVNKVDGGTGLLATTLTADGQFRVNVGGRTNVRLRVSSTGTGTVTVASNAAGVSSEVALTSPLPQGANTVGAVTSAPSAVTGSVAAATIGTSSAQVLAAATRRLLAIDNESATATIACAFGATAAINTAGSFTIPPGQTRVWRDYPVPADAVNCIASAPAPATVEAN